MSVASTDITRGAPLTAGAVAVVIEGFAIDPVCWDAAVDEVGTVLDDDDALAPVEVAGEPLPTSDGFVVTVTVDAAAVGPEPDWPSPPGPTEEELSLTTEGRELVAVPAVACDELAEAYALSGTT